MLNIEPFEITVDPVVLSDLHDRIARTRWPDEPPEPGWTYGTESRYLRGLLADWREFDWPAFAKRLNELPHYRARIDDQDVHFAHVRGTGPNPLPIVLTHGWPGSFLEYLDLIPLLTRPDDPADAFDVIVPSLPGFGFSAAPVRPKLTSAVVADLWQRLMTDGLGHQRFAAQGSDIGAAVTTQLGLRHPDHLIGVHLSSVALPRPTDPETDYERRYLADWEKWFATEGAYMHEHSTKPQTLGYGLTDSPAGLAGWITEKYRSWSDSKGEIETSIGRERLLATLTLYWITGTINSSVRMYYENAHHYQPLDRQVPVPAGFALFPNELHPLPNPPRELAERYYRVDRWRELPAGGHFPAIEQPRVLAEEIRAFFRPLRNG